VIKLSVLEWISTLLKAGEAVSVDVWSVVGLPTPTSSECFDKELIVTKLKVLKLISTLLQSDQEVSHYLWSAVGLTAKTATQLFNKELILSERRVRKLISMLLQNKQEVSDDLWDAADLPSTTTLSEINQILAARKIRPTPVKPRGKDPTRVSADSLDRQGKRFRPGYYLRQAEKDKVYSEG
jgi:hypothetical protein